ncbi:MAG: Nramp family divalent metal transporter [Pirellulales bacterium]
MTEHRSQDVILTEAPPTSIGGILRRLGPGLIIAGSIVGSGELIGTTTTGAVAGYSLLWLIIIGCIIKVFVQVEFGRYAISTGNGAMVAMNETPGPRIDVNLSGREGAKSYGAGWLVWYWLAMFLVSLGQLGGIVGGVGQALAISVPITQVGREYNQVSESRAKRLYALHLKEFERAKLGTAAGDGASAASESAAALDAEIAELQAQVKADTDRLKGTDGAAGLESQARDDRYWAIAVTIVTSILLVAGRYGLIQWASTIMVAVFTLVTVINVGMLQSQAEWAVSWDDILAGLRFRLPPKPEGEAGASFFPLSTALATFGIIGVGANELISYPYWCVEKGYARFAGQREASDSWAVRARGWLRVLRWDAWCSMAVYTFATIAFYLLGAATLGRIHLIPKGVDMIRTLSVMYEPVFGGWTGPVFLFGAFAVLYSTFFVAIAGHARVSADALRVIGRQSLAGEVSPKAVKWFSGVYPFVCLAVYLIYAEPTTLVLASGAMQAMMLPMLSFSALFFRYRRTDARIRPSLLWDICLWLSALGMLIAGGWLFLTTVFPSLKQLA